MSFCTLAVEDQESVLEVTAAVDKATGYVAQGEEELAVLHGVSALDLRISDLGRAGGGWGVCAGGGSRRGAEEMHLAVHCTTDPIWPRTYHMPSVVLLRRRGHPRRD